MLNMIDERIRRAFSNAALQYEALGGLQKEIARDLLGKVRSLDLVAPVLDVGMGTGYLTKKLAYYFPDSLVVGLDFSEGMLKVARSDDDVFVCVQADAQQLPFPAETFQLIVSNLAFQWLSGFEKGLQECVRCLSSDGNLVLTLFGQETMKEVFAALEQVAIEEKKEKVLSIRRLPTVEMVTQSLARVGLKSSTVDYERIKVRFPGMMELLQWTKRIGANALERDVYIGKEWLQRAAEYYDQTFRDRLGVYATFEVIWVEGKK